MARMKSISVAIVIVALVTSACNAANLERSRNYCRQTKCGKCKPVTVAGLVYGSCEICVNSIPQQVPGLAGVFGCVASATGIPNCLSLIKPGTAGKSGCYYCAKGYRLVAGTAVNGVTPYTCEQGPIANCAFYNRLEDGDLHLGKCKYCDTGYQIEQNGGDPTVFTCITPADPLDLVSNCLHQGWDYDFGGYGCGICEEKYFIGLRDQLTTYCVNVPTNNPRGCLDNRSPTETTACTECAWMIGQMVYLLKDGLEGSQLCFHYELTVGSTTGQQLALSDEGEKLKLQKLIDQTFSAAILAPSVVLFTHFFTSN